MLYADNLTIGPPVIRPSLNEGLIAGGAGFLVKILKGDGIKLITQLL